MMRPSTPIRQKGQSTFEMIIIFPLILMVLFGIIQWGLIYRTKITLNAATEMAARTGALNHGRVSEMQKSFAAGMMPLFIGDDASQRGVYRAYMKSRIASRLQSRINVLNPSSAAFARFRKSVLYPKDGRRFSEIPNDNLMYRPTTEIALAGGQKMNLQDANILQIRVDWCEELIVPVIGQLFVSWVNWFPTREQLRCTAIGRMQGKNMIHMTARSTYRMHSTYRS